MNYIVRGGINPNLILTTTGDLKPEVMVGPGGYKAKVYKTRQGAERGASAYRGTVEPLYETKCLICREPKEIIAGGRCSGCLDVDGPNGERRQYMGTRTC